MRPASMLSIPSLTLTLLCISTSGCGSVVGYAADPATTSATGGFKNPRDTVPTSDGSNFYFTATTGDGKPGVYSVLSAGGTATPIASGPPLVAPNGIAISADDKTLYIADTSAGLLKLPTSGGVPQLVAGTENSHPRGLDVATTGGAETVYFTGDDSVSGQGGVFRIPAAGGAVTTITKGAPLQTPVGIVVSNSGTIYVSNVLAFAASAPAGSVFQIVSGVPTQLVGNLTLGYPAGLALDVANKNLIASGLDAGLSSALVYSVDLTSKVLTTFNQGIAQNSGAGGVHRARNVDIFGWCGTTSDSSGTVYRISLR